MDKLLFDSNLFVATSDDWIKSIPMDLECYLKELYGQITIKPLYTESQINLLSCIDETKIVELVVEEFEECRLSTKTFHQKGANPIQEVAYSLSLLSDVLHTNEVEDVNELINNLLLEVYIDTDFFGSIAKLSAVRILLPSLLKEFIDDYKNKYVSIRAITSTRTISKEEPHLNLIRKTIEVIAAIIGDANYVRVIPYENSNDAIRWSSNIYHLLIHESKIKEVGNIVKGSFYLEELTNEIAELAWDHFLHIESSGGLKAYIESGELDKELFTEREKYIESMMLGEKKLIGLNSVRRYEPQVDEVALNSPNQSEEHFYFSSWIEKCHYLSALSWDCLILEGASEQEEELIKNILFSLHSIGLKNRMDAEVLFVAGDEKKINLFEANNKDRKIIRVVEEISDEYQFSMSTLSHLPSLIDELKNIEVQR